MNKTYDCVIIGAGPAGLSTAIRLAMEGKKTAVVERLGFPRDKVCGGFIGYENKEILEEMGVWDSVCARGEILRKIFLSAGEKDQVELSRANTIYGIGLSRSAFDQILVRRAQELGVEVIDHATHTIKEAGRLRICAVRHVPTGEGMEWESPHFVYATGASRKGIVGKRSFGAYALFQGVRMDADVALYFVEGGHLGLNRFEDGCINACYVAEESLFQRCGRDMEKVMDVFFQMHPVLERQFATAKRMTDFKGVMIGKQKRPRFTNGMNWNVGDAVATVNPVVGGGNSLALASGWMLAEELLRSFQAGTGFDDISRRYERRWKAAFERRIEQSWMWGQLSHRHFLSRCVFRLFRFQKEFLPAVFAGHHRSIEMQWESH